ARDRLPAGARLPLLRAPVPGVLLPVPAGLRFPDALVLGRHHRVPHRLVHGSPARVASQLPRASLLRAALLLYALVVPPAEHSRAQHVLREQSRPPPAPLPARRRLLAAA